MLKQDIVKVYGIRFCWLFMITIIAIYGFAPNKLIQFEISGTVLGILLIISCIVMYILDKTLPEQNGRSYKISSKIFELCLVVYTFGLLLLFSYFGTGESELSFFEEPLFFALSIAYLTFISIKLFLVYRKPNEE
ncbi:hypothetical protein [Robertmurraya sp. Marseille-Q9965]